jgi:hypothetical protein
MKQNCQIDNITSTYFEWEECEWLLIGIATTLQESQIYILIEYCEDASPQTGLYQIAVTEEELKKYFYEDRKRK